MSTTAAARLRTLAPGLAVLVAVSFLARFLADLVPSVGALVLAVALGALVANTVGTPAWAVPGLALHASLLEAGIVLLGASLPLAALFGSGPALIALAAGAVAFGLLSVELLARAASLPAKTGSLLAAGSSVCGVSAVVAVGGSIDADGNQLAYVAGTVLLFDALTLVAFPVLGGLLDLPARQFGVWAGLSMFSTGPVAAAGFAYDPVAGRWATLTKLVRNAFIGLVAVGYSFAYARSSAVGRPDPRYLWAQFPTFLLGFVAAAVVANAGVLTGAQVDAVIRLSDWLFVLAFAGLGFDIRLTAIRATGIRPILVVLAHLLAVSAASLLVVSAIF